MAGQFRNYYSLIKKNCYEKNCLINEQITFVVIHISFFK